MRVLHLSDTHLGHHPFAIGAPVGWSRSLDHVDAFRRALAPAVRGEVDVIVHSGDMFNRSRPPQSAIAAAGELLLEAAQRVPVVVVHGNHDWRGLRRVLPHWRHSNLMVVDRPTRIRVKGLALAVVPFQNTAEEWSAAAHHAVGPGVDALVAHQAFHGVRVSPGFVFRVGRQRDTIGEAHVPRTVQHILCGHIHPRQRIQVGGAAVVHPGSTERTSFSERNEVKGYAMWDFESELTAQFVDLPTRPMVVVQSERDLVDVVPGSLVRTAEVFQSEVLARGGWVVTGSGRPTSDPPGSVLPARRSRPVPAAATTGSLLLTTAS